MPLEPQAREILMAVTTATITTILLKQVRRGSAVTGALSDEPGDRGALCGVDRIVGRREGLTTVAGGKIGGTGLGRIRSAGGKGRPARNDLAAPTMEPETALKYGWPVNRATP